MDPVNALFWNLVWGWKKLENAALASSFGQRIHNSPHPSTSRLRPLNPATSHNNNNNNNGGPHACVRAAEDSRSSSLTSLSVHTNDSGVLALAFVFLLCSVSFSTVCLYTARKLYAHAPSLHFWWISSATYRPGIWTKACWIVNNGSIWTQIFLKRCQGRQGKKRLFWYVKIHSWCEFILRFLTTNSGTVSSVSWMKFPFASFHSYLTSTPRKSLSFSLLPRMKSFLRSPHIPG